MPADLDDVLKMIAESTLPTLEERIAIGEKLFADNPPTPQAEADADAGIDESPDDVEPDEDDDVPDLLDAPPPDQKVGIGRNGTHARKHREEITEGLGHEHRNHWRRGPGFARRDFGHRQQQSEEAEMRSRRSSRWPFRQDDPRMGRRSDVGPGEGHSGPSSVQRCKRWSR